MTLKLYIKLLRFGYYACKSIGSTLKQWILRGIRNAWLQACYPGLHCHPSCDLIVHGTLKIAGSVRIGSRTRIIIHQGSTLALEGDNDILSDVLICPGDRLVIGRGSSVQEHCILLGNIEIGAYCLFAPRVFASSGSHSFHGGRNLPPWTMIRLQDYVCPHEGKTIKIGSDCWIGINSVFLPGCLLPQGSVVGAGSVLKGFYSKSYSIIAGVPGRQVGIRWIDSTRQLKS